MPDEKKQHAVRLPSDVSLAVEQYADDHDISKSDTLRRATRQFFAERPYPRPVGDGKAMTDGGGLVIPHMLRTLGTLYTFCTLLGTAGILAGMPVFSPVTWFSVTVACGFLTALTLPLLFTSLPERADWWLRNFTVRIQRQVRNTTP